MDVRWRSQGRRAAKAANQELLGNKKFFDIRHPRLCCPLMATVDFHGFRLTCVARLPLEDESLVYGSDDMGFTIHADNPEFNECMAQAAAKMNLAEHAVGSERLCGPGDIEGHVGLDGRFYLLDFARFCPPESPENNPYLAGDRRSIFYKYLRPEAVRKFKHPLSSDAFARWGRTENSNESRMHNSRVTECTKALLTDTVREFAHDFDQAIELIDSRWENPYRAQPGLSLSKTDPRRNTFLIEQLHRKGLNLRHLGLVFNLLQNDSARAVVLVEMIARGVKEKFLQSQRRTSEAILAETVFHELTADFLIVLFGQSDRSKRFWCREVKEMLGAKYRGLVLQEEHCRVEEGPRFLHFQKWLNFSALLEPCQEMLLHRFAAVSDFLITVRVKKWLIDNRIRDIRTFSPPDVVLRPRVKVNGIMDMAKGAALLQLARSVPLEEATVILNSAVAQLSAAVSSAPSDHSLLYHLGVAMLERVEFVAFRTLDNHDVHNVIQVAKENLELAVDVEPYFVTALEALAVARVLLDDVVGAVGAIRKIIERAAQDNEQECSTWTRTLGHEAVLQKCKNMRSPYSPKTAQREWERLLAKVDALGGMAQPQKIANLFAAIAIACHAWTIDPVLLWQSGRTTPIDHNHYESCSINFKEEPQLYVPLAGNHPAVTEADQVRALRVLFLSGTKALFNPNQDATIHLFPRLTTFSAKLHLLRGVVECLLALDETALDAELKDAADITLGMDPRLGPPLSALLFIAGNSKGGASPPLFARRLQTVTIPNVSGLIDLSKLTPSLFSSNFSLDHALYALGPFLGGLVEQAGALRINTGWASAPEFWHGLPRRPQPWKLNRLEICGAAVGNIIGPAFTSALLPHIQAVRALRLDSVGIRGPRENWFTEDVLADLLRGCGGLALKSITVNNCSKVDFGQEPFWAAVKEVASQDFGLALSASFQGTNASFPFVAASRLEFQSLQLLDLPTSRLLEHTSIPNLQNLEELDCVLTDGAAQRLAELKPVHLRSLRINIERNFAPSRSSWASLLSVTCATLENLDLTNHHSGRSDWVACLEAVESSGIVGNLKRLRIGRSGTVNSAEIRRLSPQFSAKLADVLVRLESDIEADQLLQNVAERSPELETLVVERGRDALGVSAVTALSHLPLVRLELSNHLVSERVIEVLSEGRCASSLEEFSFGTIEVSERTLCAMLRACPNLRVLEMGDTFVTRKSVRVLLESCPKLEKLRFSRNSLDDEILGEIFPSMSSLADFDWWGGGQEELEAERSSLRGWKNFVKGAPKPLYLSCPSLDQGIDCSIAHWLDVEETMAQYRTGPAAAPSQFWLN